MDARIAEEETPSSGSQDRNYNPTLHFADVGVGISAARALPGAVARDLVMQKPSRYANYRLHDDNLMTMVMMRVPVMQRHLLLRATACAATASF
jgi:hypothetical protein